MGFNSGFKGLTEVKEGKKDERENGVQKWEKKNTKIRIEAKPLKILCCLYVITVFKKKHLSTDCTFLLISTVSQSARIC